MTNKTTMPEPVTHYRGMQYYTAEMLEAYAAAKVREALEEAAALCLDACDEWSGYVEVDNAPRTLREHVKMVIDHARHIEGGGE